MIGLSRMDKTSVGQFRLFVVNVLLANTVKELESAHLGRSLSGLQSRWNQVCSCQWISLHDNG